MGLFGGGDSSSTSGATDQLGVDGAFQLSTEGAHSDALRGSEFVSIRNITDSGSVLAARDVSLSAIQTIDKINKQAIQLAINAANSAIRSAETQSRTSRDLANKTFALTNELIDKSQTSERGRITRKTLITGIIALTIIGLALASK